MQATELQAGRELDYEVAKKVMGWPKRAVTAGFRPSTSIADAWQIVERIAKQWANTDDGGQYHRFVRWLDHETLAEPFLVSAPELALAICKAALAAVEAEKPAAG